MDKVNAMNILIIGLNHKSAEINDREVVSKKLITPELRREFIKVLLGLKDENDRNLISEIAILTTCNRSEFIMALPFREPGKGVHFIMDFIAKYFFEDAGREDLFYAHFNEDAVRHLFSVASSLDSMIIGEPQILGQLKEAYNEACRFNTSGQILNKLFHKAFNCAKSVRTETKIAASPVSVSYAAVELSKKIFNSLSEKKVLLLGAGEMGKLTVKHFIKYGVRSIYIANRTKEKAHQFIEESFGATEKGYLNVIDFSEYYKFLPQSDIVLCSTGAEDYVLKYEDIIPVIKIRKQRPLFLIDISMPRNIDPEINKIPNVYLFDIDDIGKMIENNLEIRKQEADAARELIEGNVREFINWKESLNAVPVIISLRNKVKEILEVELSKYIGDRKEKDLIINSLTNKILHEPTVLIKKASANAGGINPLEMIKTLFNLDSNDLNEQCGAEDNAEEYHSEKINSESKIKLIK
ncbi:MAG: glutamyl-tRNA reductase [bacterium]